MHFTFRCVNDLLNYIQGLFHLKDDSLSNTHTEVTLDFFINITFARKTFLFNVISGFDTGCFRHQYNDFGDTNLGGCKFNPK